MRRFTKDELEQLQVAENYFNTVIKSAYKRATGGKLDTLVADLYDKATGGKIARNFSCGICSFNMYKQVGEKYFADKEFYNKVDSELEPKVVNDSESDENTTIENNEATDKEETLSLGDLKDRKDEKHRGRKGNRKA